MKKITKSGHKSYPGQFGEEILDARVESFALAVLVDDVHSDGGGLKSEIK